MSGTKYGQWRYLFVQQRKLEAALAAGVKSLAELAESLVVARPEPQLTLVALEDERGETRRGSGRCSRSIPSGLRQDASGTAKLWSPKAGSRRTAWGS